MTLEEDELFYETSPGSFIVGYDATTKTRSYPNHSRRQAWQRTDQYEKDDLKKMSKDGPVEHLQNQILHHYALSEQRNMLWVLLNKAEASRTLAMLQLEELANDKDDLRYEHSPRAGN